MRETYHVQYKIETTGSWQLVIAGWGAFMPIYIDGVGDAVIEDDDHIWDTGNPRRLAIRCEFYEAGGTFEITEDVPLENDLCTIEPVPDPSPKETPEETPTETATETPAASPTETPKTTPAETPERTPTETAEATRTTLIQVIRSQLSFDFPTAYNASYRWETVVPTEKEGPNINSMVVVMIGIFLVFAVVAVLLMVMIIVFCRCLSFLEPAKEPEEAAHEEEEDPFVQGHEEDNDE
jgi:Na+-transporting methylmalonyl-CoA/oxaloacetate decarboxylase gamma subunit